MTKQTLIEGDIVVTMNENRSVLDAGAVLVEGDTIRDVGSAERLREEYEYDEVVGGKDRLVMPGFVNAHDHLFITLTRSLGEDLSLLDWGAESVFPTAVGTTHDALYAGCQLSLLEMVKSGTTHFMDDTLAFLPLHKKKAGETIADAALDIGIPGIIGAGGIDLNLDGGVPEDVVCSVETTRKQSAALIDEFDDHRDIDIWTSPTYPPWCSGDMYQEMKALADEKDTWVYSHVAEVFDEVKLVKELVGKRPVEYLDDLGVLDDNCLLAHVIWVTDGEIERIARSGANVTHQPICNQYLASGVAPIPKMLDKGINVGMGIDDGGHTNQDFCSLMKHGSLLHKVDQYSATAISAEKILDMATIGGAKAIGKDDEIGSLEPGKRANIILFDQNKLNLTPRLRPVTNLVYGATAKDVETTIINGEVIMHDREFPNIDEEGIRETAEAEAWDLIERVGIESLVTKSTEGWDRPSYDALNR